MTTHYTDKFVEKLKETKARAREPERLELKIEVGDLVKPYRDNHFKQVSRADERKVYVSERECYFTTEIQKVKMRRTINGQEYIIDYEHGGRDGKI